MTKRFMTPGAATLLGAVLAAAALLTAPAAAAQTEDEGLGQVLDPNQAQGSGRVVIRRGHIDFGPTLNTGEWKVQIHDDTSVPRYWRDPADVVLKVSDAATLTIPDDEVYSFLGLEPGSEVHVVPQTQHPDVVWSGWNTQEPGVLEALNLGATLSMVGVDGPGELDVYLQSGNFGEPQPLWDSSQPFPQDTFIEVNTHTHANWVFSEPGIYLVEMEFSADLVTGESVSARDTLRFAVGDATDAESAFDLEFDDSALDATTEESAATPSAATPVEDGAEPSSDATAIVITVVVGVVLFAIIIAVVVVVLASRRAKERAFAAREQDRGRE